MLDVAGREDGARTWPCTVLVRLSAEGGFDSCGIALFLGYWQATLCSKGLGHCSVVASGRGGDAMVLIVVGLRPWRYVFRVCMGPFALASLAIPVEREPCRIACPALQTRFA